MGYPPPMPDGLYETDIFAWSRHQAALLRRLARGERVNDLDWDHVVQEIEDVGLSELNAVRSYLRVMLVHLLKLQGCPASPAASHWREEIISFQSDAQQRFAPSMRRSIDLAALYIRAVKQLAGALIDGVVGAQQPPICPVSLDDLLHADRDALEQSFAKPDRPSRHRPALIASITGLPPRHKSRLHPARRRADPAGSCQD
ncbi:DUF29 domain-containing protein [Rhodopila sp.]|uniref:DUF29 domain-containing protein n=1 Tax=Rhodopila sp. TaxID=2480087 RepID=UPI003D0BAB0F